MYLRRLIYSEVGKYVMSILLGLGLATLFRKVCNDRSCLVFHAPHILILMGSAILLKRKRRDVIKTRRF
jgi:hypothetical protein